MANVSNLTWGSVSRNPGWFEHPEQKIEFLLTIRGILKKIFWDLHDFLFYDKEAEFCLLVLRETFWFKDSDKIMPRIVNEKRVMATLETVFRFAKVEGTWTDTK